MNRTKIEWTNLTWNPITGCPLPHCWYCVDGNSRVLMSTLLTKKISDIRAGDSVFGITKKKYYWKTKKTVVTKILRKTEQAIRITFSDGRKIICSPNHRWLVKGQGWKYTTGSMFGKMRRKHITKNSDFFNIIFKKADNSIESKDFMKGYLSGVIKGDGLLKKYDYSRVRGRKIDKQFQFRLAMKDKEAIRRTEKFLRVFGINVFGFIFENLFAIRACKKNDYFTIKSITAFSEKKEFLRGFLAGIYDAEGTKNNGLLRIYNSNERIIKFAKFALSKFNFKFSCRKYYAIKSKAVTCVSVLGGLSEHIRFLQLVVPAIPRKKNVFDISLMNMPTLKIIKMEKLAKKQRMVDLTTKTGNFVVNGLFSHNCYAKKLYRRFPALGNPEFLPKFFPKRLKELGKLKKPSKIFVCSCADLFAKEISPAWRIKVFNEMSKFPQHTYQLLTKRPHLIKAAFPDNVWVGTTVTCQSETKNIEKIGKVTCGVRFVSFEPLLEQIYPALAGKVDWVIIGKLTGSKKIPLQKEWVESLISQAKQLEIPVFVKNNVGWKERMQEFPGGKTHD